MASYDQGFLSPSSGSEYPTQSGLRVIITSRINFPHALHEAVPHRGPHAQRHRTSEYAPLCCYSCYSYSSTAEINERHWPCVTPGRVRTYAIMVIGSLPLMGIWLF